MKWRTPLAASTALAVTATFLVGGVAQAETTAPLELSIVADGTVPFDADDAPGNDSSAKNGVVRTHDTVQYRWSWQAPDRQPTLFTQTLPEGMEWTEQAKSSCVNKDIALSEDKRTLDCELVPKVAGGNSYEPIAKVKGIANNLELTTKVENAGLTSNEVTVRTSATPKWNISTLRTSSVLSVQGSDFGSLIRNYSYIWAPVDPQKGVRGIEPIESYSFKLAPNLGPNTSFPTCTAGGNWDRTAPYTPKTGTVTCDQPTPGGPVTVSVTGADTSLESWPTHTPEYNYELPPSMAIAGVIAHHPFTPLTDYADEPIEGKSTLITEFDPDSVSGQSNYGEGYALNQEPGAQPVQKTSNADSTDNELPQGINSVALPKVSKDSTYALGSMAMFTTPWQLDSENKIPEEPEILPISSDVEYSTTQVRLNPDQAVSVKSYLATRTGDGKPSTDMRFCYRFDPDFIRPDLRGAAPFGWFSELVSYSNDLWQDPAEVTPEPVNRQDITVEYGTVPYPGNSDNCGEDTGWYSSIPEAGGAHKVSTIRVKFAEAMGTPQTANVVLPFIRVRNVDPGTESKMHVDYRYKINDKLIKRSNVGGGRPLQAVGVALTPELSTSEAASTPGTELVWQAKAVPNTQQGRLPNLGYRVELPACVQYVNGSASIPGVELTPADHGPDGQPCTSDDVSGQVLTVNVNESTLLTELPQFTFRTVTLSGEAATAGAPLTGKVVVSSTADPREEALRTATGGSTVSAQSAAPDSDGDGVSDEREIAYGSNPNQADQWPKTTRVSGKDRYTTAVEVSKRTAHTGDTVLIARGDTYPDALAGGSAAAKAEGVLLLTAPNTLPGVVRDELRRIQPGKIIVLGGRGAVSPTVERHLKRYSNNVTRISGSNRYETAAKIATTVFGHSDTAMLATGLNFPDALSLASAASIGDPSPILLTSRHQLSADTRNALNELHSTNVVIGGGTGAVSQSVEDKLAADAFLVKRYAGKDRYQTSALIAGDYTQVGAPVMYSTGVNFPDALVAAGLAHEYSTPLLLSHGGCRASSVAAVASGLGAYYRYLIGGTRVLPDSVLTTTCK